MELSGSQQKEFNEALLDAFSRFEDLQRMVTFGLEKNLEAIAGSGPLKDVIFRLVEWAMREGRTADLISAAQEANPTNSKLKAFIDSLERPSGPAIDEDGTTRQPLFVVPHGRNPNFSGREAQLAEIEQRLAGGDTTLAIAGMGGLGKTQLALEFCRRQRDAYDLIYWLNGDEPAALGAGLAGLAGALGVGGAETGDQERQRRLLFSRLENAEARWLLVYDNADSVQPRELKPYLPRSAQDHHLLITTRNRGFRRIAAVLELGVFEPREAVAFLHKRSGLDDEAGAAGLAQALGHLPLALEHASAYIEETGIGFAGYLDLFEEQRGALWAESEPPDAYHATAATTWELSLAQLAEEEAAIQLLELCSFLAPEDIPLALLREAAEDGDLALPGALQEALLSPLALNKATAALQRFSLLARSGDSLEMHRLVQAVMRDRMGERRAAEWAALAVDMLLSAFPEDLAYSWHAWREGPRLMAHTAAAVGHADRRDAAPEQVAHLYNNTGYYLQAIGDYAGARPYYERALAIYDKVLGAEHPDTAQSLNNLGTLLRAQGEYEAARPYFERALAIREKVLGAEHPDTATSLNNLGLLLRAQGEYEAARPYFERALAIREKVLGAEHPDTASSLWWMGVLAEGEANLEEALSYYQRAYDIFKRALGTEHPDTKNVLGYLRRVEAALT